MAIAPWIAPAVLAWYVHTASPGHFDMFWTRDLSFSVPSLTRLGHQARLHASLDTAWACGPPPERHTTTIHYFDRLGDVFEYGVDSLPLFMAALRSVGATDLVEQHRPWLARRVEDFHDLPVDPATGLVRNDRKFSAHRDTVADRSNAFGTTMVAPLAKRSRRPAGSIRRSRATSIATTTGC